MTRSKHVLYSKFQFWKWAALKPMFSLRSCENSLIICGMSTTIEQIHMFMVGGIQPRFSVLYVTKVKWCILRCVRDMRLTIKAQQQNCTGLWCSETSWNSMSLNCLFLIRTLFDSAVAGRHFSVASTCLTCICMAGTYRFAVVALGSPQNICNTLELQ